MAFSVSFVFKATDKYSAVLNKIASATKKLTSEMNKLDTASGKFKTCLAGISTESNQLIGRMRGNAKATGTYTASMKQATAATKAQASAMKSLKVINGGRATGGGGGTRVPRVPSAKRPKSAFRKLDDAAMPLGMMGAAMVAPAAIAINEARKFQSSFSELRKVFNGTNAELAITRNNILDLANKYPMASEGIVKIAADASEAGIKFKELNRFTEIAIQASVAFDMSSEDVGEALAKTKNAFKMTVEEMNVYGDQVNYLSNNQASKAREIINKVKEISGMASVLHLSAANTAAFASTMIHTAQPVERVDGAIKDLMRTLGSATTAPKRAQAAFRDVLGVPAAGIQRMAETKPLEAMMFTLKKIKELPHGKIASLSTMFGGQYSSEMAALVEHYDELSTALKDVNNREKTRDSMLKEYITRSKTLDNQLLQTKNIILNIAEEAGNALLPVLNDILLAAKPVLLMVFNWVRDNPRLAATILVVVSALGGLAIALAGIGILTTGITAVSGALSFLWGPIGLVIAGIAALSAGAIKMYTDWKPFRDMVEGITALLGAMANALSSSVRMAVDDLSKALKGLNIDLKALLDNLLPFGIGGGILGLINGQGSNIGAMAYDMAHSIDKNTAYEERLRKGGSPMIPAAKPNASGFGERLHLLEIEVKAPPGFGTNSKLKTSGGTGLQLKTGGNMH